jgi:hypothetical protein
MLFQGGIRMNNYDPFRYGISVGSDKKCPICGVAQKNQHSLRQSAKCDWLKRPVEERNRILAAQQREAA